MDALDTLLENNRKWAQRICAKQPDFFERLALHQTPQYLWIGCADSRVSASQIVDLPPGEIFVHRNIANMVVHSDLNCLSVIQYAVEVLHVEHVIVAGHYGCGGVTAALAAQEAGEEHGLMDSWLGHIRDVYRLYKDELHSIPDFEGRCEKLCELNVAEQVRNVVGMGMVKQARAQGQTLQVHGWIYSMKDGLLRDLDIST
ncbi:MAG: carbonate dehydratase [Spirochaetota bacterium]